MSQALDTMNHNMVIEQRVTRPFTIADMKGVRGMMQEILLNEYGKVVKAVLEALTENPEWKRRYHNYCLDERTISTIKKMRKAFRLRAPIYSYLTISKAMNADATKATFDLRYQGQSIADLVVSAKPGEKAQGYEVALQINQGKAKTSLRDFGFTMAENASGKPVWSLKDAAKFRAHFKKEEPVRTDAGNKKNREHRFESEILTDMRKKSADGKILCNMQPVLLCGERFQMPTPLSASDARKDNIKYAKKGGGIDILARAGHGGNTNLCIIEVKDQNESKEPPQAAMKQAVAYAAFIWRLLRADEQLARKWWKMFGFGRDIPAQLTLFAVVAMPAKDGDEKFPGAEIQLDQDDKIVLHYIEIDETTGKPISKTF